MAYQYIKGAISCSNATSYTGSFVKIQALGDAGDVECLLDRVEFGQLANPEISSSITHVVTNLEVSHSAVIEGPIYGFKLANGSVLAYYTD